MFDITPQANRSKILLVDDNAAGAQTMAMLLRLAGYEVVVAEDGATALTLARMHDPAVVILDIGLPDMSGHEVARRIREAKGRSSPVMIAVSGFDEELMPFSEEETEFDYSLSKPVNYDDLERVVRSGLSEQAA